jgi:CBS domain containing-hemolysin-like protein
MKIKLVKELMIPLSEYATVNEEDTLKKAIATLQETQIQNDPKQYKHRAVLVYDKTKNIVGKVSAFDVLRSLEPKYCQIGEPEQMSKMGLSRFGLSNDFLSSMLEQFCLWDESAEALAKKASKLKVKEIMYSLSEGEFVDENASIAEAIHQLILGHHQSLLVSKDKQVIGILKLSDVFKLVCDIIIK